MFIGTQGTGREKMARKRKKKKHLLLIEIIAGKIKLLRFNYEMYLSLQSAGCSRALHMCC